MKSGEVANLLGVNQATVKNWVERPEFQRFFSDEARGEGVVHRVYSNADMLVLNTIRHIRAGQSVADWQAIADALDAGQRIGQFPEGPIVSDQRTIPINQAEMSARAAATLAERDAALAEVDRLRGELKAERQQKDALMERIIELSMRIGRLEGRLAEED